MSSDDHVVRDIIFIVAAILIGVGIAGPPIVYWLHKWGQYWSF